MDNNRSIVPGEIEGYLSGCIFCASLRIAIPEVGTRFRVISGFPVGAIGTVIEWHKKIPKIENEFMAQFDHDPPEWQTRVSLKEQMIQTFPLAPTPAWAPPLCLEDASHLDKIIVYFCEKSFLRGKWKTDWNACNGLITTIWHYRLPLEPNELWFVLQAHGVPEKSKKSLLDFYVKGRNLLIYSHGRKPIKKKRVIPLSI